VFRLPTGIPFLSLITTYALRGAGGCDTSRVPMGVQLLPYHRGHFLENHHTFRSGLLQACSQEPALAANQIGRYDHHRG